MLWHINALNHERQQYLLNWTEVAPYKSKQLVKKNSVYSEHCRDCIKLPFFFSTFSSTMDGDEDVKLQNVKHR